MVTSRQEVTDRLGDPPNTESDFGCDWADQVVVSAHSKGATGGPELVEFVCLIRHLHKQAASR